MKRLVLSILLTAVCAVVALFWFGRPSITKRLRVRLEKEITRATHRPIHIDDLSLSVFPLALHLGGVAVGNAPSLADVGRIDGRLWALASLSEWRPVLTLQVDAARVDLSSLPKSEGSPPPATPQASFSLPPLHVKELILTQAQLRFRLGNSIANLTVADLTGHLESGMLTAGLTAGVEVHDVEMQRKTYRAKVHEIRADGGFDNGGLYVRTAQLDGEGITVAAHATATAHRHAVSATFDPGLLGVVVDELSFISGQAQVDGTLSGDLANPILDGRLLIRQGAIARHVLGDLDTHMTRKGATLGFDDLRLVGTPGQVTGAVELVIWKEVPIRGDLSWQGVDLEGLLGIIGRPVPFSNRFTATTAVRGQLDPLDLDVKGSGTLQTPDADAAKDLARFDIGGRIRPHDLDAQLEVTQREQNRMTTRVVIAGEKLGGSLSLNAADLTALNALLPRPVPALALSGQAEGSADLSGTTEHPAVGGTVAMRNLTVAGAQVPRLSGDFRIAAGTLSTKAVRLESAAGNADGSGVLALEGAARNDWRLDLHDLNTDVVLGLVGGLTQVHTPLNGGTLNGTLTCRGTWTDAETRTDLIVKAPRVGREPLDRIEVHTTTTLPQWTLQLDAVHAASETLTVAGTGEGLARLQLTLDSTPLQLATWRGAARRKLTGTVNLHGRVSGDPLQPDGFLELTGTGLGLRGYAVGDVLLRADGARGEWNVKGNALDGAVTLASTIRTQGAPAYTLAVTWQDADLARAQAADPQLQVITSGEVSLAGSLRSPLAPTGTLRVTRFEATREPYRIVAPEPIRVEVNDGRFRIASLALSAPGSRLSVTGEGTIPADIALDVRGEGDLVLLELIGHRFESTRGEFALEAHVAHRAGTGWEVRGQGTVRDAVLDLGLPVAFTDTNGSFTLVGGSVRIDNLGGRAGGGEVSVGGRIDLNRGPAITWKVHELALNLPEWLEERVSGEGVLEGTWKRMTLRGDVEVLNALYDRRIELGDLLPWFKERIAPAPRLDQPTTEVRLDLHIHAPDGLFIDNNFAKAEMRADLRIAGDTDKPTLSGTVEVLNGEVTVRNRVYTITGGAINFQDPYRINPLLNFNAESRVATAEAEYTVTVAVSGTADNPRVQFSSDDPGLSQNDVLSLVTLGQTVGQAQRESGGVGVGDVLALLPSQYTGDVRHLFGVDRLEVEPAYVRDTGNIEPRVTVGKDITDRFRALASSSFGVDARRAVQIEYRVTRRISLLGSWEGNTQSQAGAFGGDIKFRYEFRRIPFSLFGGDRDPAPRSDAQ